MRRRTVFILALSGAAAVALVLLLRDLGRTSELGFIARATGIQLPRACSDVDVLDNGENFTAAHLRIPRGELESFAAGNGFRDTTYCLDPWISALRPENRLIPGDHRIAGLEGAGRDNPWMAALDMDDGRLWVVVFYPDSGGAAPP
jgi:hypothetical protein